ncbi:hypothetical protein BD410DRAFT_314724 [Rickenella mellea]|uniref:Uncharacterized protein n=1 Tax=Rickenella mellea TaxID=50990 RepID=A0A4Y7Q1G8_9AGAM|nr:hypothetical protein BD410DRAFT_314724 [Rickenella mellea]
MLTRTWPARTFIAHRREGVSLSRAFSSANVISVSAHGDNGGEFLQPPILSREPTHTTFSLSHHSPNTTSAPTRAQSKRPIMTPALTIFSSTASSYDYEFDVDDEVYDSAHSQQDDDHEGKWRKGGLLDRLKRWTGGYNYTPPAEVSGGVGVVGSERKTRGRTPGLEAGVLYSQSPPRSPLRSESYKSDEAETPSLARIDTRTTTTMSRSSSKTTTWSSSSRRHSSSRLSQIGGYGHGRADSDVTIQPPLPSFSRPANDGDAYTAIPSRVARSQHSRSRSTSPVKRTLPTLQRVDSTVLPLSPPLPSPLILPAVRTESVTIKLDMPIVLLEADLYQ